jgi:hypothetical protein
LNHGGGVSAGLLPKKGASTMAAHVERLNIVSILLNPPHERFRDGPNASGAGRGDPRRWRSQDTTNEITADVLAAPCYRLLAAHEPNSRGSGLMLGRTRQRLTTAVHHAHQWRAYIRVAKGLACN